MSKRILLFGVVLSLALVIIIGFVVIQKKSGTLSNPLKAIPTDASVIIQVNDFRNFYLHLFENNKVMSSLNTIDPFTTLTQRLHILDSLAHAHSNFGDLLFESKFYISGHFIGGRKTDFLFICQQQTGRSLKNFIDIVGMLSSQDIQKTERKYEGKPIYVITIEEGDEKTGYYLSEIEGNIVLSKSVILIENALRQYSLSRSLFDDSEFTKTITTAGKSKHANLFVDLSKFPGMLSLLCNTDFGQKLKKYQQFGRWMELDLNATENQIMLNGFMLSGSSDNSFESVFRNNSPVNFSVENILPAFISSFITVGAEDMVQLNQGLQNYLGAIGKKESRSNQLQAFENKYGYRLDELFLSLIENEITLARGTPEGNVPDASSYILLKCKSGAQAQKSLSELVNKVARKQGRSTSALKHTYSVDSDTKYTITEIPLKDVTGLVFGGLFSINTKSYFTVLGNYLVISNSVKGLGNLLYSNVLSKTLSTNAAFKSFSSNLAQKSYFVFYSNLARSSSVFSNYMHNDVMSVWEDNFEVFHKIQPFGFQITEVSDINYANILVQHLVETKGKPKTVWESLLDTSFTMKPQLVENHYTKQNEVFLQDELNNIYLINKAGRILWKQKITETINSKIYQIDYYKNGKLQYLFSSDNYLHLIDRNGNYTERYPVRLRARSTAGMALFDYEKNKNYRIFIPCNDKQVYAYTKDGSIISGWQFKGSEYPVNCTPVHFALGGKDFIVFADKVNAYILDRRGNTRVQVNELLYKSRNNTFYLNNNSTLDKSRIITTDTTGAVVSIDFSGNIKHLKFGNYGPQHYFDFKDVDANGTKDYIMIDENRLEVYGQNKEELFNFSIPNDISQPAIYFNFSYSDRKIGLVDNNDRKIYLLNRDGKLYKGFPLEGTTLFSIGYLEQAGGKFNLIVGGSNNFLYNYSVH